MGMYTELFISCRIKNDPQVIDMLKYMIGKSDATSVVFNHQLFKTDRWSFMLKCSSYYFVPFNMNLLEYDDIGKYWTLISRSDFKNYDDEVNLFIDWLKSHIEDEPETMIGYSRYEEDKEPIIYYL